MERKGTRRGFGGIILLSPVLAWPALAVTFRVGEFGDIVKCH
jgi:hypothetical protein